MTADRTRIANITAIVNGPAESVLLCESTPSYPVIQIGSELTLLVGNASAETLLAISLAFAKAADLRTLKAVA